MPKKGLGRVFDRVANPLFAAVRVSVANQQARRAKVAGIERHDLVAGQHLHHHPLVTLVGVQRFHHPVAPVPDVLLTETDLVLETVPVAVAPNIQPVTSPAFTIMRAFEQSMDGILVGAW